MMIYKVFQCSKCDKIIELRYNNTKKIYAGFCKTCNREIETKSVGDEQKIKDKYVGGLK